MAKCSYCQQDATQNLVKSCGSPGDGSMSDPYKLEIIRLCEYHWQLIGAAIKTFTVTTFREKL